MPSWAFGESRDPPSLCLFGCPESQGAVLIQSCPPSLPSGAEGPAEARLPWAWLAGLEGQHWCVPWAAGSCGEPPLLAGRLPPSLPSSCGLVCCAGTGWHAACVLCWAGRLPQAGAFKAAFVRALLGSGCCRGGPVANSWQGLGLRGAAASTLSYPALEELCSGHTAFFACLRGLHRVPAPSWPASHFPGQRLGGPHLPHSRCPPRHWHRLPLCWPGHASSSLLGSLVLSKEGGPWLSCVPSAQGCIPEMRAGFEDRFPGLANLEGSLSCSYSNAGASTR